MTKRGRPRKDGPRYDCGQLKIEPTDEMKKLRAMILPEDADVTHASSPRGLCLAWGLTTTEQDKALHRFGLVYRRVTGWPHPRGISVETRGRSLSANSDDAWHEEQWRLAQSLLGRYPRAVRDDVESIAVFERHPKWLRFKVMGRGRYDHSSDRRYSLFSEALNSLAGAWGWREAA